MSDSLVPSTPPEPTSTPSPTPAPTPKEERRCEGCGCKIDVRGRIIERGEKLKGWLDAEDDVRNARKLVTAAQEKQAEAEAALARVTSELARFKNRKFGEVIA